MYVHAITHSTDPHIRLTDLTFERHLHRDSLIAISPRKTIAIGGLPTPEIESVTMHELTDKTQDAIAMAVKINGHACNEVDIIVTATTILKQATPSTTASQSALPPAANPRLPIGTPTVPPRLSTGFSSHTTLSTLPEM